MKEEKKLIKTKQKASSKFIEIIKTRWLISGTNTILLIAILIALFFVIDQVMKKIDLTPIDCTSNKQYTITDETKTRVKDIKDQINIYLVGYKEEDTQTTLAKQYNKANENIKVELVDITQRLDLKQKYNIEENTTAIIIENGERNKIINSDELYTFNETTYEEIDLTEEKLTSGILTVTTEKVPTIYFLEGYTDYTLSYGLEILSQYLENEIYNTKTLNLLTEEDIPEDCDNLIIFSPIKDFDEKVVNSITNYINRGGQILWLNSSYAEKLELPNVNKILALYGIEPFEVGYVYETDKSKTALGYTSCIIPEVMETNITKNITKEQGVVFLAPSKINIGENLEDLNVARTDLVQTSETSYFRTDPQNTSESTEGDEQGGFTLGVKMEKTISKEGEDQNDENEIKSNLIIYSDANFASDLQLNTGFAQFVRILNNKDLMINSIADLTEQDQGITIRKDILSSSNYTPTDAQKSNILKIIFIVPFAIIILGIIIWQVRRRKK